MQPIHTKNRVIGLLGGSFNPAHGGHLHITLYALRNLGFDEVWWLVTPRNPLKSGADLAAYEKRLALAREVAAHHPRIRVLDVEAQHKLRYSYQTVRFLQQHYPGTHFVWMMGADNLAQFHRWRRWQQILADLPVVVFDRAPYSHMSLRHKTFLKMHKFRLKNMDIRWPKAAPSLIFIHLKRDPHSSTHLRKTLGKRAFLGHNKTAG